jgi:hypothetical protein
MTRYGWHHEFFRGPPNTHGIKINALFVTPGMIFATIHPVGEAFSPCARFSEKSFLPEKAKHDEVN